MKVIKSKYCTDFDFNHQIYKGIQKIPRRDFVLFLERHFFELMIIFASIIIGLSFIRNFLLNNSEITSPTILVLIIYIIFLIVYAVSNNVELGSGKFSSFKKGFFNKQSYIIQATFMIFITAYIQLYWTNHVVWNGNWIWTLYIFPLIWISSIGSTGLYLIYLFVISILSLLIQFLDVTIGEVILLEYFIDIFLQTSLIVLVTGIYHASAKEKISWNNRNILLHQVINQLSNPNISGIQLKENGFENKIAELSANILGFQKVFILIPDYEGENLILKGGFGINKDNLDSIKIPINEGVCGKVFKSRMPHLAKKTIKNGIKQCKYYKSIEGLDDAKSELACPILRETKAIGVIDIQSDRFNDFSDEDVLIVTALANAIAIKLEAIEKYIDENNEESAMKVIEEATSIAVLEKDYDKLLQDFFAKIIDHYHPDILIFYRLAPGTHYPILPPDFQGKLRDIESIQSPNISESSILFHLISRWKPDNFNNVQNHKIFTEKFKEKNLNAKSRFVIREGVVSTIVMPLGTSNDRVGLLFLNYQQPTIFNNRRMIELQAISNLFAI